MRNVHNRENRTLYVTAFGTGPYVCGMCDEPLDMLEVIHHVDEDRENNRLDNLMACHDLCHQRHHHVGLIHTEETKRRIRATLREKYESGERSKPDLAAEKNPFYGKSHSEETKKKISDAKRGVPTGRKPPGMTGMRHSEETKKRMSEAAKERWRIRKETDSNV